MKEPFSFTRRAALASAASLACFARAGQAASARQIQWDDLIPPGVPYAEIIGEGDLDLVNDTWKPVFDANAVKLNADLDDLVVRMPGYIIPMEASTKGVTGFMLVPYVGACIHVPPPPANQLVYVTTEKPWPSDDLWDAIWVTGRMSVGLQTTELAEIGYRIQADQLEHYENQ